MKLSEAFAHFDLYYLVNNDRSQKTRKEYRAKILGETNGLTTFLGNDVSVESVGLDHVILWKASLREQGLNPAYINDHLSALRLMLKWCKENECRVLDWRLIGYEKEETNKPKITLSPEDISKLVICASNLRDKAVIQLFFGTAMRSAELLSVTRYQWDGASLINKNEVETQGTDPVWEIWVMGKNKKHRPVWFYQGVKDAVDMYLDTRVDRFNPLFISNQNRVISYSTISRMLHTVARQAGLTKIVTQHILRHSYATEAAANGMPIPNLSYQLGHSNASTTLKIYTHINVGHSRRAYSEFAPKIST